MREKRKDLVYVLTVMGTKGDIRHTLIELTRLADGSCGKTLVCGGVEFPECRTIPHLLETLAFEVSSKRLKSLIGVTSIVSGIGKKAK